MVDVTWGGAQGGAQDAAERARALHRLRFGDVVFHAVTRSAAIFVLLLLGGVMVALLLGSLPALRAFGFDFVTTQSWNPVTEKFGALAPIYGTLMTSFIAMAIAVPFGLLIAMFLTELCPMWLRRPIGIAIELLAGIPSIIYGIWGLFVLAPFLQQYVQPALISAFGNVPVLSTLSAAADPEVVAAIERYVLGKHARFYLEHLRRQVDRLEGLPAGAHRARDEGEATASV